MFKTNKHIYIFIFVFLCCFTSQASRSLYNLDSLLHILPTLKADSQVARTQLLISEEYARMKKNIKGQQYVKEAFVWYSQHKEEYPFQYGVCHLVLGVNYNEMDSLPVSLEHLFEALKYINEKNDKVYYYNTLNFIARSYFYQSKYIDALEYYLKCLRLAEKYNWDGRMATTYTNIGNIYHALGKLQTAKEYQLKALQLFKAMPERHNFYNGALNNLANSYERLYLEFRNKTWLDSARMLYMESVEESKRIGDSTALSTTIGNIGNYYKEVKNYSKAIEHYKQAIDIKRVIDDMNNACVYLINWATILIETKDFKGAIKLADESLKLSKNYENTDDERDAYEILAEAYAGIKNFEKAYEYSVLFEAMTDSLFNESNTEERTRLEMNYNYEKEQHKKALEQARKDAVKEEQIQKQRIIILFSGLAILLIAGLAFVIFRSNRKTKEANNKLSEQKDEIEQKNEELNQQNEEILAQRDEIENKSRLLEIKNEEIVDSIYYARRIQQALLTTESYIRRSLASLSGSSQTGVYNLNEACDFFIYYHPKDIVSGDFYWAFANGTPDNNSGQLLLATADCTGHGVPGAFMSMLGINFLNELAIEKKMTSPSLILNELRDSIVNALNPESANAEMVSLNASDMKDGMDMALYSISFPALTLIYAAANRPVWILREDKRGLPEIIELKGNNFPVGLHSGETKPFQEFEFQLQKGDVLYTFTDGYADQFGGYYEKKFKQTQLKDLFCTIYDKPMHIQRKIVNDIFNEWKGRLDQIDDVLVIGLRI